MYFFVLLLSCFHVCVCQCPTQHDEDEEASLADVVEDRGAAGQPVVHVQEVTQ